MNTVQPSVPVILKRWLREIQTDVTYCQTDIYVMASFFGLVPIELMAVYKYGVILTVHPR